MIYLKYSTQKDLNKSIEFDFIVNFGDKKSLLCQIPLYDELLDVYILPKNILSVTIRDLETKEIIFEKSKKILTKFNYNIKIDINGKETKIKLTGTREEKLERILKYENNV